MSIEVANIKEKLIRAALRAEFATFPGELNEVEAAIKELPRPDKLNKLSADAKAWLLEQLTKYPTLVNAKDILDDQKEYPIWIVWKLNKDIPILVAIDTSEEKANKHVDYIKLEAKHLNKPAPETFVEESRLNHLYGQTISDLGSFKVATIMARNRKRDQ